LFEVYGVHPWQYRDYAALRGDPSDNLPGVRGFGAATAARCLSACGTLDAFFEDPSPVRATLGGALVDRLASEDARATIDLNRSIMRLRAQLPLPPLESTRLPVDRFTMRQALSARGINLGPSLWALTGGTPPDLPVDAPVAVPLQQPWVWRRSARRTPAPGQLALF